ncbi:hypothetical protein J2853_008204 [Streptosporangium lutulentum]|uniref:Uncharacterized protein n=2 Tax=Streptosporangium lutulentum TaxID=1461250 RepID=A0ABT9QQE8_9ACTN|nr:hypothetical protein [Streptosporangium lutulentum]
MIANMTTLFVITAFPVFMMLSDPGRSTPLSLSASSVFSATCGERTP